MRDRGELLTRKAYRHPLVGELDLRQENFALPDDSGLELLVLSAAPGSPSEDALRLLGSLEDGASSRGPAVLGPHDQAP